MRYTIAKRLKGVLKFIPLTIGIACIAVSVLMLLHYLRAGSQYGESYGGFDILHDPESELNAFVGLVPMWDLPQVSVTVLVQDWDASASDCGELVIAWPGTTFSHRYLLKADSSAMSMEEAPLPEDFVREFDPDDIEIFHDPSLNADYIRIYVGDVDGFCGAVNFVWVGGLRKTSYSQVGLFLPFQMPLPQGVELESVSDYRVQLYAPNNCELDWSIPQASEFQFLGKRPMYNFDIDVEQTDLMVMFNNTKAETRKQQALVLYSGLLGMGFALTVEEISRYLRHTGSNR